MSGRTHPPDSGLHRSPAAYSGTEHKLTAGKSDNMAIEPKRRRIIHYGPWKPWMVLHDGFVTGSSSLATARSRAKTEYGYPGMAGTTTDESLGDVNLRPLQAHKGIFNRFSAHEIRPINLPIPLQGHIRPRPRRPKMQPPLLPYCASWNMAAQRPFRAFINAGGDAGKRICRKPVCDVCREFTHWMVEDVAH